MTDLADAQELRRLIWDRLSARPESLELDERTDEEPEDYFVRLAHRGQRDGVVRSLRSLLIEQVAGGPPVDALAATRFLPRAVRLCDMLEATECKAILKQILLQEETPEGLGNLSELRELGARALLSLPKTGADFMFWADVAQRQNTASPYALNAAIEIDVQRGVKLLCGLYLHSPKTKRQKVGDWSAILEIGAAVHGEEAFGEALADACADVPDPHERFLLYEHFVYLAGIPTLSRHGQLDIEDILSYSRPERAAASPVTTTFAARDLDALLRTSQGALATHGLSYTPSGEISERPIVQPTPWFNYHAAQS